MRSPGGGKVKAIRFDYNKMEEVMPDQSPGPMTGTSKSFLKGTIQLP